MPNGTESKQRNYFFVGVGDKRRFENAREVLYHMLGAFICQTEKIFV